MLSRRSFVLAASAAPVARGARVSSKERVDRALKGQDVDRVPFSVWYHFGLEKSPPIRQAQATLDFHRKFRTDLVKVMSDYPYPKPKGEWYDLRVEENPFPQQIQALEIIRDGLAGGAYFIETIFNPWNVAEKLSSKEAVLKLKNENPQALLQALDAIAQSEARHAKKALAAGAAGIFLAIANAEEGILSLADYTKFSQPFDRMVLESAAAAPLNVLHLHGDKVYLDHFLKNWPAAAINYSVHGTGVSVRQVRNKYAGLILAGLDERIFRKSSEGELRDQWQTAAREAGKHFLLAPGCSIPNDTQEAEIRRLMKVVGA